MTVATRSVTEREYWGLFDALNPRRKREAVTAVQRCLFYPFNETYFRAYILVDGTAGMG